MIIPFCLSIYLYLFYLPSLSNHHSRVSSFLSSVSLVVIIITFFSLYFCNYYFYRYSPSLHPLPCLYHCLYIIVFPSHALLPNLSSLPYVTSQPASQASTFADFLLINENIIIIVAHFLSLSYFLCIFLILTPDFFQWKACNYVNFPRLTDSPLLFFIFFSSVS